MNKYNVTFTPTAFEDYKYWQTQDKKLLKKINSLIKSIQRNGILEGEGKPEPLKGNLTIKDPSIIIIACRYHY